MNLLALASMAVSLLGWISYMPVVRSPRFRGTLWPTRVLLYGSLLMAGIAFALPSPDRHTAMYLSATCASFAIFTLFYYILLKLPPAAGRPEVGKVVPEFEVTGEDGKPFSSDRFVGKGPVLFIFFRGMWCISCSDELQNLREVHETIQAKGGQIVAICVQPLAVLQDARKDFPKLPVFLACDPDGATVRKLNLVHAAFGKIGKTLSIPANILIDPKGVVQWAHYSELVSDRPDPRLVLKKVLQFGSNAALFGERS